MIIEQLHQLDGIAQRDLVERKQIKPEEVVDHYIAMIEKKNPQLNAVVHTMFKEARSNMANGVFKGLPFLIKDLNALEGQPLTYGSKIMEGFQAFGDDEIVRRFKDAGLTMLGKTNTPEFGFTPATESVYLGYTKNPWNPKYSPGGSSGGAAAAVAAGMAPFAHGSDGGGSIRIPASNSGLFGLKPTRGRTPLSMRLNSFAVSHALTRSVRDSAALLDVLEGPQIGDMFAAPKKESASYKQIARQEPKSLKIAYMADFGALMDIDSEVQKAIKETAQLCEELGHEVVIDYPDFDLHKFMDAYVMAWVVGGALSVKGAAQVNEKEPTAENLETMLSTLLEKASGYSAIEYEQARVFLATESAKIHQFFKKYDVLLHPVTSKPALPLGCYDGEKNTIDEILAVSAEYAHLTPIANVTGQPAMSVPLYWNEENLPIGSHFMGRFGDEATLFKLAAQLERARPWFGRYREII